MLFNQQVWTPQVCCSSTQSMALIWQTFEKQVHISEHPPPLHLCFQGVLVRVLKSNKVPSSALLYTTRVWKGGGRVAMKTKHIRFPLVSSHHKSAKTSLALQKLAAIFQFVKPFLNCYFYQDQYLLSYLLYIYISIKR